MVEMPGGRRMELYSGRICPLQGGIQVSLPTDIMLRPARLQDIPEIARISAGIWDGEDYVPRVAAGWISDPSGRFVAAEHEGIVRGFGRIVMHTATDAWRKAFGIRVLPRGAWVHPPNGR